MELHLPEDLWAVAPPPSASTTNKETTVTDINQEVSMTPVLIPTPGLPGRSFAVLDGAALDAALDMDQPLRGAETAGRTVRGRRGRRMWSPRSNKGS